MSLSARVISLFLAVLFLNVTVLAASPKLVVLLAIDQLRPDRLSTELPGGLGRLMREGYVFSNATLDHAVTNTCPGHVVMSTGVNPGRAGIPGNSFIDHETMAPRYCVDDDDKANVVLGDYTYRSPNNILVSGLGDWLKETSPRSKVFAVAGKDRSAITLAGKQADGVYWYNYRISRFTTSGYYARELPDYVRAFNGEDFFVDGFGSSFPATWVHEANGVRKDDYIGESQSRSRTSGHPLNVGQGMQRAENIYRSPYLDIATHALVKRIIQEEQLGQRGVTDMLALSFSSTDLVGHLYGPYSHESVDSLRILDHELGVFLTLLDDLLGGDYLIAVSSDHGVLPLPEYLKEQGKLKCPVETGRIDLTGFGFWTYWHLYWRYTLPFGDASNLLAISSSGVVVNQRYAEELGVTVEEVVDSLESYFEKQPAIKEAWTADEILQGESELARLYRNSYVPGKSGHLSLQVAETCIARAEGTSHGSPYHYDRHVPLIFFGKGIASGQSDAVVHSVDMAPTLAEQLGLKTPAGLDGTALNFK